MEPWVLFLILLLGIHSTLAEVFKVTGPDAPIVAMVGGVAVLECQLILEKPSADIEVRWVRSDSERHSVVHLYRFGQDALEDQDEYYRGRTMLFKNEFKQGNVSLQLKGVRLQDEGDYLCMVEHRKIIEQAPVQLKIASLGLRPTIQLDGYHKAGIGIQCKSSGWYPAPMMQWTGGNGKDMTDKAQTTMTRSTAGFYSMSSAIEVTSISPNTFKCLVHSPILKRSEELSIHIPDQFFPRTSGFLAAFILFLLLFLGLLAAAGYFILKKWKYVKELRSRPTIREFEAMKELEAKVTADVDNAKANLTLEKFLSKTAAERVLTAAVPVTFDSETANPYLMVSADQLVLSFREVWKDLLPSPKRFDSRLFVMATDGYQSGCQYWEVFVGGKPDWDLGVIRESISKTEWASLSPENGYWTIGKRGNSYEVNAVIPRPIAVRATAQIIGIHLNWAEGKVGFYNADDMAHIYTLTAEFTEKIYPFFSPWGSQEIMKISPL